MNWYYAKNGSQEGPIPTEALRAKIDSGEVAPSDLAWREGQPDWLPVYQIPEFSRQPVSSQAVDLEPSSPYGGSSSPAPAPASYSSPSPYQAPQVQGPAVVLSSGLAVAAMICGILGFLGCWVPVFSILLTFVTIILGHIAVSKASKDPSRFGGTGMARTGLVLGYIGLLFGIASTTLYIRFALTISKMSEAEARDYMESYKWLPVSSDLQKQMHDALKAQQETIRKRQEESH